jgi:citrate synthase
VSKNNHAVNYWLIFHSDHEQGLLLYRGYTLEQLWEAHFEEMLHLLVWETFPTTAQRTELRQKLARHMQDVPNIVYKTILSFPYDLTFIAVLCLVVALQS